MPEPVDWSMTTYEGNRRRQHLSFLALPFREKIIRIQEMEAVAAHFASLRDKKKKSAALPKFPTK